MSNSHTDSANQAVREAASEDAGPSGIAHISIISSISREWLNFTRECMEQNVNQFESLLRCRTPQDITAVQSEILRDNLESFLQCARRIAKISMRVPDEANNRAADAVEGAQAA